MTRLPSPHGFLRRIVFFASAVAWLASSVVQRINAEALAHPNEKPVELMSYFVEHLSSPGDTVLDPFMGVGPTVCAAKALGRGYIGIEREEEYVRIAEARVADVCPPIHSS